MKYNETTFVRLTTKHTQTVFSFTATAGRATVNGHTHPLLPKSNTLSIRIARCSTRLWRTDFSLVILSNKSVRYTVDWFLGYSLVQKMLFFGILSLLCVTIAWGKRYQAHNHVGIVANTVGPFNNPTETYPVGGVISCPCVLCLSCFFSICSISPCRFVLAPENRSIISKTLERLCQDPGKSQRLMSLLSWILFPGDHCVKIIWNPKMYSP